MTFSFSCHCPISKLERFGSQTTESGFNPYLIFLHLSSEVEQQAYQMNWDVICYKKEILLGEISFQNGCMMMGRVEKAIAVALESGADILASSKSC